MTEKINTTKELKLFSSNSIWTATFLGGPLAFGYMMWKNCLSLGQNERGKIILIVSIIITILLFLSLFLLPENFIDKIPRTIIPIINAAIAYIFIEKTQGEILKKHKKNGNEFYSLWNVVGITIVSTVVTLAVIFAIAFIYPQNEAYDIEIAKFSKNEYETLVFYDDLNTKSKTSLLEDLDTIIPKWKENIEIINKTNQLEDLPNELKEQNKLLLEYAELRVKTFELLKKAIYEDTDKYSDELDELHFKIDKTLEQLN
ncbi:MAG TPA: hypothetical protein VKY44_05420 [Flavobacterium sp.]|nr:hypothetical protein [Flavobacterium sp.]